MPEPTDHIILTPGPDGWSHRYTPPPFEEDGHDLFGFTNCCKRMIGVPRGEWPQPEAATRALLKVTDCCDRPFALHGPKPVELPPYSGEHTTCRKCGSKAVETQHKGPGVVAYWPGMPTMTESMLAPSGYPKEWLARRCAVCQATWDEATIPAPSGDPEPEEHRLYTYGLRRPRITDLYGHYPYQTVAGRRIRDAVDAARELAGPKVGPLERDTELVRRRGAVDPWEVVLVADGQYGWIEPEIAEQPEVETVTTTSEPDAALYMACPLRHPLALRTTAKIEGGARRALHHEVVCPQCEADGTTGLIALGGVDG